ncbi:MAG: hypothetical protein EA382_17300 [Spirochaetaceae bacterium]|nr:MAG: hypothetical protein EA382_17300 [Spirochaetaceae bacterium]
MTGTRRDQLMRIGISMLIAFGPASVLVWLLNPTGPLWIAFAMAGIVTATHAIHLLSGRIPAAVVSAITFVTIGLAGLMLAVNIVIVPFSAYLAWFDLVADGTVRGSVSFVFVMAAAFFTTALSVGVYRRAFLVPIAGSAFIVSMLLALIYQHWITAFATVTLLAVFVVTLTGRFLADQSRVRAVRTALAAFVAVVFLSTLLGAAHRPRGSYIVDARLAPMLRDFVVRNVPRFPVMYATPGYGYSFEQSTFGEAPTLSSSAIFSVYADPGSRVYLRTEVARTFDGRLWAMEDPLSSGVARAVLTRPTSVYRPPLPFDLEFEMGFIDSLGGEIGDTFMDGEVHVALLGDFYPMMPHTLDMERAVLYTNRDSSIIGTRETGFRLDPPIVHRDTIVIQRRLRPPDPSSIPRPTDLHEYTRTHRDVPASVRELAAALAGDTPIATAVNIRDYLAAESEYTLEVGRIPADADFVEHFLFESRRGYCVQYATAFTLLARLNGIPTRYATGFLVSIPYDTNYATVSGLAAHAWPEIWLPEYGWNIIEATPPMQSAADLSWFYRDRFGVGDDAYTRRQLEAVIGRDTADDGLSGEPSAFVEALTVAALPAAALVGVVALALIVAAGIRNEWFVGSPERRFATAGRRLVKTATRAGVRPPDSIGWRAWNDQVRDACGPNHGSPGAAAHDRALRLVWSAYFGSRRVRRVDAAFMRTYRSRVTRSLRTH